MEIILGTRKPKITRDKYIDAGVSRKTFNRKTCDLYI